MDLYAYTAEDPVNGSDPSGLDKVFMSITVTNYVRQIFIDVIEDESPNTYVSVTVNGAVKSSKTIAGKYYENEDTYATVNGLYDSLSESMGLTEANNVYDGRKPFRGGGQGETGASRGNPDHDKFDTNKDAGYQASSNGWTRTHMSDSRGNPIYKDSRGYHYSRDVDGHNGAWKGARDPETLQRGSRDGTYDRNGKRIRD